METEVPLSHLVTHRTNVRRTNALVDIPVLAALIKSEGLQQNLLVRYNGDGKYREIDGKRSRASITVGRVVGLAESKSNSGQSS